MIFAGISNMRACSNGILCFDNRRKRSGIRIMGAAIMLTGTLLAAEIFGSVNVDYEKLNLFFEDTNIGMGSEKCTDVKWETEGLPEQTVETIRFDVHKAVTESDVFTADIKRSAADIDGFTVNTAGTAAKTWISEKLSLYETGNPRLDLVLPGITDVGAGETLSGITDVGTDETLPGEKDTGKDIAITDQDKTESVIPDLPVEEDTAADENTIIEDPVTTDPEEENIVTKDEPEEGLTVPEETENISFSIAGFLIDSEGMIYGVDHAALAVEDGYLELPSEGCIGVRSHALDEIGVGIAEINIPQNISVIEEGAFADLYMLEWIEAAPGNPACVSVDGILYNASQTTLLVFPGGRTDRYAVVPGVTKIASQAFANTNLICLDLWQCGAVEIEADLFGGHNGNGMEIVVPAEYADWYQEQFAGYDVQIL